MRIVSISKVTIAMITYNSPLLPYSHPDFLSPHDPPSRIPRSGEEVRVGEARGIGFEALGLGLRVHWV